MAKETLAVKFRPKSFDDLTEQEAIKIILEEQIRTKTFKHAYLFCGPAGCGKTTSARIFANMINEGQGSPIEIDAASNSGVDNIRTIIDDAKRKSLDSEYKVYIVDECHSLSNGAWQALLKLLEEPPKFTIFILCTTDPQKIPATIISRVQRYQFNKISTKGIENRLKKIIQEECQEKSIDYDTDAISYIAKMAEGGMRDSITMMDKCLSLSRSLTTENVVKALGTVDYEVFFKLLKSLSTMKKDDAIKIIEQVFNDGKDLKQFINQFQQFMVDVSKYTLFKSFEYIHIPNLSEYTKALEETAQEQATKVLSFIKDLAVVLKWETNPKDCIETAILLMEE